MLSFDITDRNIRIIKGVESNGKIRINSAATLNLEEEIIVNGHVKDVPRLATLINQVLKSNRMADKEAIISISSNLTIFKELHIPKAKEQDFVKMVRAEMQTQLGIDESYSVSYVIVGEETDENNQIVQKVLATACPYEIIDCYKRVFSMLTISLRSVMIGCNCITKVLLSDAKIKSKMPLLAVQIDNNFISLNLYEKGQLSFSRFASISAEDYGNSDDYVFEAVNENIFRMMQFQKSKNTGEVVENVVFYGDTHEFVRLTNALEQMGVRTSVITVPPQIHGYENLEFSSYANAIGAMFKRNKETERINLLETDTFNNNKIKSDKSYGLLLGVSVLATAVVMLGAWGALKIYDNGIKDEIKTYQDKIDSPETKAKLAQLEQLKKTEESVTTLLSEMTDASDAFKTRPYILKETYDIVEKAAEETATDQQMSDMEVTQFDYSAGVLNVKIEVDASEDPAQKYPAAVTAILEKETKFYYVDYKGYQVKEETDPVTEAVTKRIEYTFTVDIKGDGINLDTAETTENTTGEEGTGK